MNICFINVTDRLQNTLAHPNHDLAPLDIGYCASILDDLGHNSFIINTGIRDWTIKDIITFLADNSIQICVLKTRHDLSELVIKLASEIKKISNKIFVMGPFPTLSPESFIYKDSPVDVCIIGEPEYTLKELIEKNKKQKTILQQIKGITYFSNGFLKTSKRELITDLDALPFPKHDFYVNEPYRFYYPTNIKKKLRIGYMLSSRGCPFKCSFCSVIERASHGDVYRSRSPALVVDEMQSLVLKGINFIYFEDDLFTFNPDRVEKICDEIIKRNIRIGFAIQSRVDTLNKHIIKKLKQAGCSTICFGIETKKSSLLKRLNKKIDELKIRTGITMCKKEGIKVVGFFMIGIPGETIKSIEENIDFAKKLKLDMITVSFYTPYIGSADHINTCSASQRYHSSPKLSYCDISAQDLINFQKKFYKSFYFNPRYVFDFFKNDSIYYIFNFAMQKELVIKTLGFLFSK